MNCADWRTPFNIIYALVLLRPHTWMPTDNYVTYICRS